MPSRGCLAIVSEEHPLVAQKGAIPYRGLIGIQTAGGLARTAGGRDGNARGPRGPTQTAGGAMETRGDRGGPRWPSRPRIITRGPRGFAR